MFDMARTTHVARITGQMPDCSSKGEQCDVPMGPCLVEQGDGGSIDIIWGAEGENVAALSIEALAHAKNSGSLKLLD